MIEYFLRYKWAVILFWVFILFASIYAIADRVLSKNTIIDNSVGIWFRQGDPDLKIYEDVNRDFGKKEWMMLLLHAKSIYEPHFLKDLVNITHRIENIKHVNKVISITNVHDFTVGSDGSLQYIPIYNKKWEDKLLSPEEIQQFRRNLHNNPIFEGSLFHQKDNGTTMLLIQTDNIINSIEPYRIKVVDEIKGIVGSYPSLTKYSLAGTSVVIAELNRASQRDVILFYILVTILIIVVGYFTLKSTKDLIILLVVVSSSALPPMALIAILGIPYNMVTVMLPPILVTLSVCDVIHVINAFHYERITSDSSTAIVTAIRKIWVPCLWTTVITMIGFISLAFSHVIPILQMGVYSTLGIFLAWLITMTCVPVLLVLFWPRSSELKIGKRESKKVGHYSRKLLPFHSGRYRWLWGGVTLVLGLTIFGVGKLEVDTNYTEFFGKQMYISKAYPDINKAGYGNSPILIVLEYPKGKDFATEGYYKALLNFEDKIRKLPEVNKLMTFTDLLGRTDEIFNGKNSGDIKNYTSKQLHQLYFLSELAGNDDLKDYLAKNKTMVKLVSMSPYMSSLQLAEFKKKISSASHSTLPADINVEVTGTTVQWSNMDKEISHTEMNSMYILSIVFLVLLPLIFRSFSLGVIGVLINMLPLAATFGVMGLLDIKINLATAMTGGIAIGSTVDSTIFFINRVRFCLAEKMSWSEAVDNAVITVGDGIIMTSIILTGGFFSLATSSFLPTADFGGLVTISIILAVFMDIIVNPIVLKIVGKSIEGKSMESRVENIG